MSRRTEEVLVDDKKYYLTHFNTERGIEINAKVGKLAGKPVGMLIGAGMDGDINGETIGGAFESFFSNMAPEDFVKLAKDLVSCVEIDNGDGGHKPVLFNVDFSGGDLGHLYKLIWKVLVFQFGFLQKLVGMAPALQTKVTTAGNRIKAL